MITFRDYQLAGIDSIWGYFRNGGTGNPIVVLPTGTGKSLLQAGFILSALHSFPRTRILCLTHVKELIKNNFEALLALNPAAPAGIFSAGLKRKDLKAQVTFAGIASIRTRAALFQNVDLIMIDECHLVSDSNATTYRQFIAAVKTYNPHVKVIGMTATPFRAGLGMLTDGTLFDDICFDLSSGEAFVWMIQQGYLSEPIPKNPTVKISMQGVGTQNGEFAQGAMAEAIEAQGIIPLALREAAFLAQDRKRWLVFAASLAQVEESASELNELGIPADFVHSKIPDADRDARIAAFKAGRLRALVNKDILTTGFDCPEVDCIIMLRPTKSASLWVQMLGRGTRPVFAPGFDLTTQAGRLEAIAHGPKRNCLVLDFAGNTERLGPINYPRIPKARGMGGGGDAPVRECPQCKTMVHISVKICPDCGYEFPVQEKLSDMASSKALVTDRPPEEPIYKWYTLWDMTGVLSVKEGRPDIVRVTYAGYADDGSGGKSVRVFLGPEHTGYMFRRTKDWWALHAPTAKTPLPKTTAELLDAFGSLRKPERIKVLINTPYPEVTQYDFSTIGRDFAAATRAPADAASPARKELSDLSEFS